MATGCCPKWVGQKARVLEQMKMEQFPMLKYQKGKIILVIFLVFQSINFKELIFNLNFLCVEI